MSQERGSWELHRKLVDLVRILRRWTVTDLAKASRLERGTVSDTLAGGRRPQLHMAISLVRALDLDSRDALRFTGGLAAASTLLAPAETTPAAATRETQPSANAGGLGTRRVQPPLEHAERETPPRGRPGARAPLAGQLTEQGRVQLARENSGSRPHRGGASGVGMLGTEPSWTTMPLGTPRAPGASPHGPLP